MAKYSMKKQGKEVGPASTYAEPHTMGGEKVTAKVHTQSGRDYMNKMSIGVGPVTKGNFKPTKTDGITMRGGGAATKGLKCRGPMG